MLKHGLFSGSLKQERGYWWLGLVLVAGVGGSSGGVNRNNHYNGSSNTTVAADGRVVEELLWHGKGSLVATVDEGASAGGGWEVD